MTFEESLSKQVNTDGSIYGGHRPLMEAAMHTVLGRIEMISAQIQKDAHIKPIDHVLSRIKSEESMREKCRRNNLDETEYSALYKIHDAIGIRIVCAFVSDVYAIKDMLLEAKELEVVTQKDYIRHAKDNGYRSLHLIIRYDNKYYIEIQIRTISQDTWAALEHSLKYKKNISSDLNLITSELKRCADELASTEMSMQTIRDMINQEV